MRVMRVLEVMGSLHKGGAETMIMNYYRAFDKDLCQMDFVVHAEFEDDYRAEAKAMGANIIVLPRPGSIGLVRYIRRLRKAIKENGPYDAVHIHTDTQVFMAVIAAREAGVKRVIAHSHNTRFDKKRIWVNRVVCKLAKATCVGCGQKAGESFFGKQADFTVLHNAIPASKFMCTAGKPEIKAENAVKTIGHLARFTEQKNHPFIVEIADCLKKRAVKVQFCLYGGGALETQIRQLVKERELEDYIQFMGLTNDAPAAYRTMDLFILPSLYEGFPVTLVESQLSGVPSLAADTISRECDLGLGLLTYLPLDVEVWADEISRRLQEGSLEKQMLSDEVIAKYDVAVQWERLFAIYKGERV